MSKDSLLVIISWLILCVIDVMLWKGTVNTEQKIFYDYYFSFFQFITLVAAFLCFRTMKVFEPNDINRTAWGLLGLGKMV